MSVGNSAGSTENLFDFEQSQAGAETDNVLIFEEFTRELEAYLARETDHKDSTDGIFDLLSSISDSVQEEFEELISGDSDKKRFLRAFSRIFTSQHKSRHDWKDQKNFKDCHRNDNKNMARTKATVRRLPVKTTTYLASEHRVRYEKKNSVSLQNKSNFAWTEDSEH